MNKVELGKMLRSVGDAHHRINSGGCACVAVMITENLPDYIESRIVSPSDTNIDEVRELVDEPNLKEGWYDVGVWFAHVWVEVNIDNEWLALDSTGIQDAEDMHDYWGQTEGGSFTLEEMVGMANQKTWNPTFNRNQLPSIKKMIEEGFAGLGE